MIPLGKILKQVTAPEKISDTENERFVTVKLNGGGAVERKIQSGKTPKPFLGYRVEAGQFIYSRIDARNGAFAIIPTLLAGAVVSKDFPIFEIDTLKVDANYFIHLMKSGRLGSQIRAKSFGATNRQRIKEDVFLSLEIPLPPLDEQRRIAAILNSHQQSIRSCQNLCEKLGQIEDSIFDSIFSTENRVNKLSDLIDSLQGGKSVVGPENSANPYRVLKISATTSGVYRENETKPLPNDFIPNSASIVKPGDVLISRANTSELIGASALVTETNGHTTLPDKLWRATPKPGIDPLFLHRFLSSPETRREMSRSATGSGGSMKNISKSKLLSVPAFIPSESQQGKFRKAISSSSKIRVSIKKVLATQEELTESLQSRAFRGEL